MEVVNYASYNTPATHHDLLHNLRDFAIARGWTIDYWEPDSAWTGSGTYSFTAGTEHFLQMHTHGYGSNYGCFRFLSHTYNISNQYGTPYYGSVRGIFCGQAKTSEQAYSTSSSYHPVGQGTAYWAPQYSANSYGVNSLNFLSGSDPSFLKQYCFGNDKFIDMFVQYNADVTFRMFFGIPELIEPSLAECQMKINTWCNQNGESTAPLCTGYTTATCAGSAQMYYDGQVLPYYSRGPYFLFNRNGGYAGPYYDNALVPNSFALARPILRDMVFVLTGGVRQAFAYMPYGWTSPSGLQNWQELDYGAETYMACPVFGGYTAKQMLVYRIA